ncbi:hypothetical protein [Aquabacterium sp.]|uniref:hypothetical protein n=1 Tax=Aquabacterium sp. TaxID=1872578 RepID=UPI002C590CE3|nr:hypothetical protein [Aquabacterium sp.]HSW08869.1 hypothetical protein [Aquabacterium sp.]
MRAPSWLLLGGTALALLTGACAAEPALQCRVDERSAVLSLKGGPGVEVVIPRRADICEAGYSYEAEAGQPMRGLLMLAPRELGLNAKNVVYRISFADGEALKLGELPASAERGADGRYQNVIQQAGSLFLEHYEIDAAAVRMAPVSHELVFDGELCTDAANAVHVRGIGVAGACSKRMKASMARPVCVAHRQGSDRVVPLVECEALSKRLGRVRP